MSSQAADGPILDWKIDASHSVVEFSVRHVLVSTVKGWFPNVSGRIHYDPDQVGDSSVEAEIDVAGVTTHAQGRDDHLRSENNFDVARYPTASFASTQVEPGPDGTLRAIGELTFHGVTQSVPFSVTFDGTAEQANGITRAAFTANGTIRRTDFGLAPGRELPGGGTTVSNEVRLTMHLTCQPAEQE